MYVIFLVLYSSILNIRPNRVHFRNLVVLHSRYCCYALNLSSRKKWKLKYVVEEKISKGMVWRSYLLLCRVGLYAWELGYIPKFRLCNAIFIPSVVYTILYINFQALTQKYQKCIIFTASWVTAVCDQCRYVFTHCQTCAKDTENSITSSIELWLVAPLFLKYVSARCHIHGT